MSSYADAALYIDAQRKELESWIERRLAGLPDRQVLERAIHGGKRLRPIFLLLVFEALGGRDRESALEVAFALELAHAASLVHDDIIDWDDLRRGKPALWRQVGISRAVVEGHRIINLAFKTVLEKGIEISRIFLEAWDKASLGVLEEILSTTPPSQLLYLRIIENKTASLFAAAAESAAILAEVPDEVRALAKSYGRAVGVIYQVGDDYGEMLSGGGILRLVRGLGRVEELVRQGYFALKAGKLRELVKVWRALKGFQGYIHEVLKDSLREVDNLSEVMPVDANYKRLLREFPRYCFLQMVRGSM
ncbi:MAG: polyprenyl synthetase family protein [Nitrososphaerota archaeon]|nr:polyprenyl synthetase family protein [Candidatus Calditenuaceae archaeon]MDW8073279.1 polyprenyl synthetase family protein [Nitrososphaerota archaeon]